MMTRDALILKRVGPWVICLCLSHLLLSGCGRPPESIAVSVYPERRYSVGDNSLSPRQYSDFLKESYKRWGPVPLVLVTETNLLHKDLRAAMDIGSAMGYWHHSVCSASYTNPLPVPALRPDEVWVWEDILDFETGIVDTNAGINAALTNTTILIEGKQMAMKDAQAFLTGLVGTQRTNIVIHCYANSSHDNLIAILDYCDRKRFYALVMSM